MQKAYKSPLRYPGGKQKAIKIISKYLPGKVVEYREPMVGGGSVFMFLDPPYMTAKRLYGREGTLHAFDHVRLADSLRNTEHKFLMTYDDCPEVRNLYRWAEIQPWTLQYGMNNCNKTRTSRVGSEVLIANYALELEEKDPGGLLADTSTEETNLEAEVC